MSEDPRRTGFCTPTCYRECQCSRWPDLLDRWGNPVNHGGGVVTPGWWLASGITPWAAYNAKGAASFAASLIDLTGNGNDAIDPGGLLTPGWVAGAGWIGTGSEYLMTSFVPANDQSQSVFIQFTGLTIAAFDALAGCGAWPNFMGLYPDFGGVISFANGDLLSTAVAPILNGNMGLAGNKGYINGVADAGVIPGWGAGTADAMAIMGLNNGGVVANTQIGTFVAAIIYDVALTAPQAALIVAAMAAL